MNYTLPSLGHQDLDKTLTDDKERELKEQTKLAYRQFELDQKNRSGVYKRTGSPVITYELLKIAPIDFFKEFNLKTKMVTSEIINAISITEGTIHISNHKKNPTDPVLKETILYIVMSEFSKIDSKNDDVKMMRAIDKDILLALVINEVIGLGPLEPLWNEGGITEIISNGPFDVQVELGGIVRKIPSVKFRDKEHLKSLIDKLYGSINKQLSPVNPRERGRLHDNSRMYAIHEVIAPKGPNFNIRKHAEDYWTINDIIAQGTANIPLMHDVGNLINSGVSFLVVGGTGTGKTTLLNALTGFIKENDRIITLEENLEMKPHPGKLIAAPMECVPARAGDGQEFGVTMRDLVRSSLQMRPDVLLIGEVSDGAAYDLCQALNTGHYGGSTVHANDAIDGVSRMLSLVSQEEFVRGTAVLDLLGSAFDIIIVVDRMQDGSRKITEVVELGRNPVKLDNGQLSLEIFPLWEFEAEDSYDSKGKLEIIGHWKKVGQLSEYRQKKHRIELKKQLNWAELEKLFSYDVPVK